MKLEESLEDFIDWFVHLCYQYPKTNMDWMYLGEKLWRLVCLSLKQVQSEMNPNIGDNFGNLQFVNQIDLIHNHVLPTFVSREKS